ncbi:hypothetical protein [Lysobacter enzymogenes]|nr:hypothetical protein [Lysobacter enzymogenes]
MEWTGAMPERILVAVAKVLGAIGVCLLAIWAWMALAPGCRFALDEWTWQGRAVSKRELCPGEFAVRPVRRDGRECLELYALKDGLPVGERCPRPDTP